MSSIYEKCNTYENEKLILRPVELSDAPAYLKIYSDKKAQPFFNCDNFSKPCYFQTLKEVEDEILFYMQSYEQKAFVRWSIADKKTREVIGSVENFNRKSEDYYNDTALLRMDLRSDYEEKEFIKSLLSLIEEHAFYDFYTDKIATKAIPAAKQRRQALLEMGYKEQEEPIIGHKKEIYKSYFELRKENKKNEVKLNRVNVICLGVCDMEKAMRFYKDGLGFHTEERDYHAQIVFFDFHGMELSLYPIEELALDIDTKNPPKIKEGFSGTTLAYNTKNKEEVDQIMELALKAGARLAKKPQEVFWGGYSGYFMDLDGYYWEVVYNPQYIPD